MSWFGRTRLPVSHTNPPVEASPLQPRADNEPSPPPSSSSLLPPCVWMCLSLSVLPYCAGTEGLWRDFTLRPLAEPHRDGHCQLCQQPARPAPNIEALFRFRVVRKPKPLSSHTEHRAARQGVLQECCPPHAPPLRRDRIHTPMVRMMSEDSCGRICCRGMYSCYWRYPSDRKLKCSCFGLSVLTAVSLLTLSWMYVCMIAFNDREDVNGEAFSYLKLWVNWFMVLVSISAVLTIYCTLLLAFALFQLALKEPLDLYCLHKLFLFLGVVFIALGTIGISLKWKEEWHTVLLSLQATAPFLQMGGVGALTLVSWLVFQSFHRAHRAASKILIMVVFAGVSVAMFLSPLLIQSPCLIEKQLPTKPALIGHRGAPMLAPENTLMSFRRSVECGVIAFETDVQLSKDRVPYLMHDHGSHFLSRTTDVLQKFPGKDLNHSTNLTWEELQGLNAGDWFLKTDPFRSVSQLSEQEKKTAGNQSVPSLLQLLDLAKTHNTSVIFDLKNNDNNDTIDTVNTILNSGIPQDLIHWLPQKQREYVREFAPGFKQVYDNVSDINVGGATHLNVKYSALSAAEIMELRKRNVSVNLWVVNEPWLFSLLWCSGASSVTTNACSLLKDMDQPDWTMRRDIYLMIWITVDLVSLLIMFALFILQRERGRIVCLESERTIPLLTV